MALRNFLANIQGRAHKDLPGELDLEEENPANLYGGLPKSQRKGVIKKDMQKLLILGVKTSIFAILGIAAFSIISFTGAPFVLAVLINAWFAGSMIYLAGLAFGIINDIIGCKRNLPYFSLGHQPGQRGVIESNNPATVGVAWGIMAKTGLSLIAGVVFAATTLIAGLAGAPFVAFVLPCIALLIPVVLYGAHQHSLKKEKERRESGEISHLKNNITRSNNLDSYQTEKLKCWLKTDEDANRWTSNSDRNLYGFIAMPLIGVVGITSLITLSAVSSLLPAVFFGAALSVFPPVGLGILLAVGIIAACVHLYKNHTKQVDNIYRLDYPKPDVAISKDEEKLDSVTRNLSTHAQVMQATTTSTGNINANIQHTILDYSAGDEKEEKVVVTINKQLPANNDYPKVDFIHADDIETPGFTFM